MMSYGLEILFYLLGVMSLLGVQWLFKLNKQLKPGLCSLSLAALALLLFLFSVAWSVSSIMENEMQAAGLGVVFFALPALIFFFLARKLYKSRAVDDVD